MTETSRVCGIPLSYLFTRGQQIKVSSLLYRQSRKHGFLIPTEREKFGGEPTMAAKFEGGFVLDAKVGYYQEPCVVLDFSSLYPSVMMAHNLCYSTIIPTYKLKGMDGSTYEKTPNGDAFIKPSVHRGVLPMILEHLVERRNKYKSLLNECEDPELEKIWTQRSLALKLAANSVYGFVGASVG
jgi:DNA polymerase delta subunit 1